MIDRLATCCEEEVSLPEVPTDQAVKLKADQSYKAQIRHERRRGLPALIATLFSMLATLLGVAANVAANFWAGVPHPQIVVFLLLILLVFGYLMIRLSSRVRASRVAAQTWSFDQVGDPELRAMFMQLASGQANFEAELHVTDASDQ